jgi:hypothetical protein
MYVVYQVYATYRRDAHGHWHCPDHIDMLEGCVAHRCSDCEWLVPNTFDPMEG